MIVLNQAGIDVRIFKQSNLEFASQERAHQSVYRGFADDPFADEADQLGIAIGVGQFQVHSGGNSESRSLAFAPGHRMTDRLVPPVQLRHGIVVGNDESPEAPFVSEDILQEPRVCVRRHAVNFVV